MKDHPFFKTLRLYMVWNDDPIRLGRHCKPQDLLAKRIQVLDEGTVAIKSPLLPIGVVSICCCNRIEDRRGIRKVVLTIGEDLLHPSGFFMDQKKPVELF